MGIGVGFCMGSFQSLMLELVPPRMKGSASGIVNTFMNIGGIIGPTIASIYISDASKKLVDLQKAMSSSMGPGMSMGGSGTSSGSPDMQAMMLQLVRDTMEPAFQNIYLLAAACSVALVILIGYVAVKRYIAVRAESQEPKMA
jgi:MFS family permease